MLFILALCLFLATCPALLVIPVGLELYADGTVGPFLSAAPCSPAVAVPVIVCLPPTAWGTQLVGKGTVLRRDMQGGGAD